MDSKGNREDIIQTAPPAVYGEQSNKRYEFVDVVLLKILKSDHLT